MSQIKNPAAARTAPGTNSNDSNIGIKSMIAVGDVIGKFSSRKEAENELDRLGYTKTKAGWMGEWSGARIVYLPATKRYQVSKVVPA